MYGCLLWFAYNQQHCGQKYVRQKHFHVKSTNAAQGRKSSKGKKKPIIIDYAIVRWLLFITRTLDETPHKSTNTKSSQVRVRGAQNNWLWDFYFFYFFILFGSLLLNWYFIDSQRSIQKLKLHWLTDRFLVTFISNHFLFITEHVNDRSSAFILAVSSYRIIGHKNAPVLTLLRTPLVESSPFNSLFHFPCERAFVYII